MPYLQELKIAFIVLAVVMAYVFLLQPRLRAKKTKILERYLYVQSASLNMQDIILKHILKYDSARDEVLPGITYKMYLRDLQKKHAAYLSEKQYKKLKKQNVLFFYSSVNSMLDKEEMRLQTVKLDLAKAEEEVSVSSFVHVN
jgi:hypothetical protein